MPAPISQKTRRWNEEMGSRSSRAPALTVRAMKSPRVIAFTSPWTPSIGARHARWQAGCQLRGIAPRALGAADDEPGAALKGEIRPQPAQRDDQAVAEADQVIDVRQRPDQPGDEAAQVNPAEVDHRRLAPDGGEVAVVAIAEGRRRRPAREPRRDQLADVGALLLRHRRDTRQRLAALAHVCGVADDEDFRMTRERQIGRDLDAAHRVALGIEPIAGGGGGDAGGPEDRARLDALARGGDATGIDRGDRGAEAYLDA